LIGAATTGGLRTQIAETMSHFERNLI